MNVWRVKYDNDAAIIFGQFLNTCKVRITVMENKQTNERTKNSTFLNAHCTISFSLTTYISEHNIHLSSFILFKDVPGFFGKQRTKAMKKQLDGNMLWRRLQQQRNDNGVGNKQKQGKMTFPNIKMDGKKLSEMTPDERVEAMIKAGMI